MTNAIRRDPLNPQAEALQDAQTEIKLLMKEALLKGLSQSFVSGRVRQIVKRALAKVRSPTLREDARKSLTQFARHVYAEMQRRLSYAVILAALIVTGRRPATQKQKRDAQNVIRHAGVIPPTADPEASSPVDGIDYATYRGGRRYMERVTKAMTQLADARAMDPNDVSGRNSLRNLAEMQVRYEAQQNDIESFRARGIKLVICSSHADCSDRCYPWQGRVYSLDGTSGRTADGHSFVPLENATDRFYTTKSGRTYKNGLLGFNCRHVLSEYRPGMTAPHVSRKVQEQEYAVNIRQREYERGIIRAKERALMYRSVDPSRARRYREEALRLNREYIAFSKAHDRAYYPDRTKLL